MLCWWTLCVRLGVLQFQEGLLSSLTGLRYITLSRNAFQSYPSGGPAQFCSVYVRLPYFLLLWWSLYTKVEKLIDFVMCMINNNYVTLWQRSFMLSILCLFRLKCCSWTISLLINIKLLLVFMFLANISIQCYVEFEYGAQSDQQNPTRNFLPSIEPHQAEYEG